MTDKKEGDKENMSTPDNKRGPKKGLPLFWIGVCIILVAGNIIFYINSRNRQDYVFYLDRELTDCRVKLEDSKGRESELQGRMRGLESRIRSLESGNREPTGLPRSDYLFLKGKGFKSPVEDVTASLMQHNEIIPEKSQGGGKFGFYDKKSIFVLSRDIVFARFDDGHDSGYAVLKYNIDPKHNIDWEVIYSRLE
jgi:hypothetical protein